MNTSAFDLCEHWILLSSWDWKLLLSSDWKILSLLKEEAWVQILCQTHPYTSLKIENTVREIVVIRCILYILQQGLILIELLLLHQELKCL